jgi:hypothetical protein
MCFRSLLPLSFLAGMIAPVIALGQNDNVSAADFFRTSPGTIGLGEEGCFNPRETCTGYRVVRRCPIALDGPRSRIFVVINTSNNCSGDICANFTPQETYLGITLLYSESEISRLLLPRLELWRNEGWMRPYSVARQYKRAYSSTFLESRTFVRLHMGQGTHHAFDRAVTPYFHAQPSSQGPFSWDHRDVKYHFLDAYGCDEDGASCSVKAFLLKFTETGQGRPTRPVQISVATGSATSIRIATSSPINFGIYNKICDLTFPSND